MGQSHSRPSSQMGRYSTSEQGGRSNSYQEQNTRSAQPEPAKSSSVVIKVGMVGDAQIGVDNLGWAADGSAGAHIPTAIQNFVRAQPEASTD